MNRKVWLTVLVSMCFLSAISLTQFIVSVRASPYTNVTVSVAKDMIDTNPYLVILDVREPYEYEEEHIKNAILIPVGELAGRLDELDKNKPTLVYCKSGGRSATACGILDGNGFTEVYNMEGGITAWKNAGYPVEVVFKILWEEYGCVNVYPVAILTNYTTVTGFNFSQPLKQINFNVIGKDGGIGFCNVTIPIALLDGNFTVLISETPISYTLTQNTTHSFIYFNYSHTTQQVKIIGTTVIGERGPVGGIWIPADKLAVLAPYISLASTIILAIAVTAAFFKYKKKQ